MARKLRRRTGGRAKVTLHLELEAPGLTPFLLAPEYSALFPAASAALPRISATTCAAPEPDPGPLPTFVLRSRVQVPAQVLAHNEYSFSALEHLVLSSYDSIFCPSLSCSASEANCESWMDWSPIQGT